MGYAGAKGCSEDIIRQFFICGVNGLAPRQGEDGFPIFGAGERV